MHPKVAHNTVSSMKHIVLVCALGLAGCSQSPFEGLFAPAVAPVAAADALPATLDPTPPPPPPPRARTVAQFDTTTAQDRAAATAAQPAGETKLGSTIATLGSPADPGIWLKSPLVKTLTAGRVVYGATGKSVNLELRPSGGDAGSGSQISLPAMRLLDAPLAGLLDLTVYQN